MRHRGWKVIFGISWLPGLLLYGNFITGLAHAGDKGTAGLAGGVTFLLLLPVVLIFACLQGLFGWLAFRK